MWCVTLLPQRKVIIFSLESFFFFCQPKERKSFLLLNHACFYSIFHFGQLIFYCPKNFIFDLKKKNEFSSHFLFKNKLAYKTTERRVRIGKPSSSFIVWCPIFCTQCQQILVQLTKIPKLLGLAPWSLFELKFCTHHTLS
jgi:hypothetical protein